MKIKLELHSDLKKKRNIDKDNIFRSLKISNPIQAFVMFLGISSANVVFKFYTSFKIGESS